MPYNIWCDGCNNHIGTGVRYNAEKSKTGNYYSTSIYKFRMKCHLCDNYIEVGDERETITASASLDPISISNVTDGDGPAEPGLQDFVRG